MGHLGGKLDRHFTCEACPLYHNTTRKAAKEFRVEVNKKQSARRKAATALAARSPLGSPTSDQKRHSQMVMGQLNFK